MQIIKKVAVGVLCALVFVTGVPQAEASTNSAQIAQLQATISRLQAELAILIAGNYYGGNAVSSSVTTGSVVQVDRDRVEFSGSVSSAVRSERGWFEYGPTRSLSYSTVSADLASERSQVFRIEADDIDRNQTYYYRAVVEDRYGDIREGVVRTFVTNSSYYDYDYDRDDDYRDDNNEDRPDVQTDEVLRITDSAAEIRGEVDMNDEEDGVVFFAYGEDEDMVDDVADEDTYEDVDTDGDDLQKVRVESSFDGDARFYAYLSGLDDDTEHFYRMCVAYEDEDNDEAMECGDVESFETDRD